MPDHMTPPERLDALEHAASELHERLHESYARAVASMVELMQQYEDGRLEWGPFRVLFWGAENTLTEEIRQSIAMTVGNTLYGPGSQRTEDSNERSNSEQ